MCKRRIGLFAILLVLDTAIIGSASAAQEASEQPTLKAEELGISLARIRYKLDKLPETPEASSLLRLNFYVEVYGRAPRLQYLGDFDIHNGPIPYGPPMHSEMLSVMRSSAPQIVPSAFNMNQVLGWLKKISR